jgi:hypothetical protein
MTLPLASKLALAQGLFFAATGAWPIANLRSFEAVTGPKPEGWLVKTVGALLAVTGGALALASRQRISREWALLGAGTAAALAAVDVWYAGVRRRISPVYLLDAPVELAFVTGWAVAWKGIVRADRPALLTDAVEAFAAAAATPASRA